MFFPLQVHWVQEAIMAVTQNAIKITAIGGGRGPHSFYLILTLSGPRSRSVEGSREEVTRGSQVQVQSSKLNRASDKGRTGRKHSQASRAGGVDRSM